MLQRRLSYYADSDFVTAEGSSSVGAVADRLGDARWVVVTEGRRAVGVISRHELTRQPEHASLDEIAGAFPPRAIMPARTSVVTLRRSPLAEYLAVEPGPTLLTRDDSIIGVVTAQAFSTVLASAGGWLGGISFGLPGKDRPVHISRVCRFDDSSIPCLALREFIERPDLMPRCPNPKGLSEHDFVWD